MPKFFKTVLSSILLFLTFLGVTYAYTLEDVQEHNTPEDCWVMFEGKVYDLTQYIKHHDIYMDIRDWCGTDITEEFKDKAGLDRDHTPGAYTLLERFEITKESEEVEDVRLDTVIEKTEQWEEEGEEDETEEEEKNVIGRRYNIIIPFLAVMFLYWGSYLLVKKDITSISRFHGIWNTLLLITFLIPSFGFGIFLIARLSKPELWNIDFEFMYWHVQFSLVMGFIVINHFIQRIPIYSQQIRGGKKRKR